MSPNFKFSIKSIHTVVRLLSSRKWTKAPSKLQAWISNVGIPRRLSATITLTFHWPSCTLPSYIPSARISPLPRIQFLPQELKTCVLRVSGSGLGTMFPRFAVQARLCILYGVHFTAIYSPADLICPSRTRIGQACPAFRCRMRIKRPHQLHPFIPPPARIPYAPPCLQFARTKRSLRKLLLSWLSRVFLLRRRSRVAVSERSQERRVQAD